MESGACGRSSALLGHAERNDLTSVGVLSRPDRMAACRRHGAGGSSAPVTKPFGTAEVSGARCFSPCVEGYGEGVRAG